VHIRVCTTLPLLPSVPQAASAGGPAGRHGFGCPARGHVAAGRCVRHQGRAKAHGRRRLAPALVRLGTLDAPHCTRWFGKMCRARPLALAADEYKSVGWEKNIKGKLGPRMISLAQSMDPGRCAVLGAGPQRMKAGLTQRGHIIAQARRVGGRPEPAADAVAHTTDARPRQDPRNQGG
jgi:hypothetical protein